MKPFHIRFYEFIRIVPVEVAAVALGTALWQNSLPADQQAEGFYVFLNVMLLLVFAGARSMLLSFTDSRLEYSEGRLREVLDTTPVDPWFYQRSLMKVSQQELPDHLALTRTSLLYGALILEEAGETMTGIGRALAEQKTNSISVYGLASTYGKIGAHLMRESKGLRVSIANLPDTFTGFDLTRAQAQEILDGTTDIMVVVAGLTEACGLPGSAAYQEIVGSNLSKANPKTGIIDKDESGKWIKGSEYRSPDLALVLDRHTAIKQGADSFGRPLKAETAQ